MHDINSPIKVSMGNVHIEVLVKNVCFAHDTVCHCAKLYWLKVVNRLTPRDAYPRKKCVYHYQRILPGRLQDFTNLKLFVFIAPVYIAEIHSWLPKIPLLPCFADFEQLYFCLTKKYSLVQVHIILYRYRYTH